MTGGGDTLKKQYITSFHMYHGRTDTLFRHETEAIVPTVSSSELLGLCTGSSYPCRRLSDTRLNRVMKGSFMQASGALCEAVAQ